MTSVSDTFQRADGALGQEPDGLVWSVLSGGVSIGSHQARATTSKTEASRSVAVLPLLGDGVFTATLPATASGGECLYFRVSDANNWWRLRVYSQTNTYQYVASYSCTYNTNYSPEGGGTSGSYTSSTDQSGSTAGPGPAYWACYDRTFTYEGSGYVQTYQSVVEFYNYDASEAGTSPDGGAHVYDRTCTQQTSTAYTTTSCTPNYSTASYTSFTVYLDKCVAGTITSSPLNSLTASATLSVTCAGQSITASDGTHSQGLLDSFNQAATGAGVGSGPTSLGNSPVAFASFAATFTPIGDSAGNLLVG